MLKWGTMWFQIVYAVLCCVMLVRKKYSVAWPLLLFLCVAPGGAVEFLLLPLPFLVLSGDWKLYTFGAVLGWLAMVLQWHLGMLTVPWTQDCVNEFKEPFRYAIVAWCFLGTVTCWLLCWRALMNELEVWPTMAVFRKRSAGREHDQ